MHVAKRSATPLRVQQLWDSLQRVSGSQGPVDFERIMTIVTSIHKVPRDEFNRELEAAIRDELIISDVIQTQKREETEIYKLPNPDQVVKGDHDWYCFECHLGAGGPVVACEDCPRIFHLDCLPDDRKPQKDLFVCPPCHIMATKPSAEKLNLKPKQLNTLLQYSCTRFKEWMIPYMNSADGEIWALASEREAKDDWRYDLLVYFHIDLTQMLDKCINLKYQSLEEFQVDCETLIHGIGVYFGPDSGLKGVPTSFHREVMHDIQEIKLCHDCFRRSNEKDHAWWFCLPCTTPHEVVWAKQSGYPYWPAKIMKIDGNKYDVRYFGGNYERGMIDAKNIQPIDTPLNSLRIRKTAAWNDAYDELQKFQDIALNPEKVNSLPATKGGKGSAPAKGTAKAGKRAAAADTADEVITKKSRKEPARKSAPARSTKSAAAATAAPTRGRKSAAAVLNSAVTPTSASAVHANGMSTTTSKKKAASSATIARRDSATRTSISPVGNRSRLSSEQNMEMPDSLDAEDASFLSSLEEAGDDSLSGDIYFSDEEQDELQKEKVSEDAVSSSVNETRGSRNAYTQVNFKGLSSSRFEAIRDSIVKYLATVKERHALEISQNKKKQWCYNCEREAIYHCCWNTAYCSIECQQLHWTKEHKRLCRRVRRERVSGSNSQGADDY